MIQNIIYLFENYTCEGFFFTEIILIFLGFITKIFMFYLQKYLCFIYKNLSSFLQYTFYHMPQHSSFCPKCCMS